jgi:hypothetical protein
MLRAAVQQLAGGKLEKLPFVRNICIFPLVIKA